jgi:hypothetical protein
MREGACEGLPLEALERALWQQDRMITQEHDLTGGRGRGSGQRRQGGGPVTAVHCDLRQRFGDHPEETAQGDGGVAGQHRQGTAGEHRRGEPAATRIPHRPSCRGTGVVVAGPPVDGRVEHPEGTAVEHHVTLGT